MESFAKGTIALGNLCRSTANGAFSLVVEILLRSKTIWF
jgi:hypothetical protein